MADVKNNFSVVVDRGQCIGCNLCCEVTDEVFYMKGEKSNVKKDADFGDTSIREKIVLASQACPVGAIKVFK